MYICKPNKRRIYRKITPSKLVTPFWSQKLAFTASKASGCFVLENCNPLKFSLSVSSVRTGPTYQLSFLAEALQANEASTQPANKCDWEKAPPYTSSSTKLNWPAAVAARTTNYPFFCLRKILKCFRAVSAPRPSEYCRASNQIGSYNLRLFPSAAFQHILTATLRLIPVSKKVSSFTHSLPSYGLTACWSNVLLPLPTAAPIFG